MVGFRNGLASDVYLMGCITDDFPTNRVTYGLRRREQQVDGEDGDGAWGDTGERTLHQARACENAQKFVHAHRIDDRGEPRQRAPILANLKPQVAWSYRCGPPRIYWRAARSFILPALNAVS